VRNPIQAYVDYSKWVGKRLIDHPMGSFRKEVSPEGLYRNSEVIGVPQLNEFRKNPNLMTGATAAVALPFPALKTGGLASKIGKKTVNIKLMQILAQRSNAEQLTAPHAGETLDNVYKMLASSPFYKGGKLKHGRLYQLDPRDVRPGMHHEKDSRLAIIQDPKTGAMFASPGDFHHGELMGAVDRIKYRAENPGITLDPSGRTPRSTFEGWMQHEVFQGGKDRSGRVNFSGTRPTQGFDTPAATIGRMRLLRELKAHGYKTAMNHPDGTSAITRLMRGLYDIKPEAPVMRGALGQGQPAGRRYPGK
jgi:hypothetical protein